MSENDTQERELFTGESGKTLFVQPFENIGEADKQNREGQRLYKKLEETKDDRSKVLVAALIVEYEINKILEMIFRKPKKIIENRDVSFALKIDLIEGLGLIPQHIIDCADAVRTVRNKYAHELDIDSLSNLDKAIVNMLVTRHGKIPQMNKDKIEDVRELFRRICFVAISGLALYEYNIKCLIEAINDHAFLTELERKNQERQQNILKELMPFAETVDLKGGGKVLRLGTEEFEAWRKSKEDNS